MGDRYLLTGTQLGILRALGAVKSEEILHLIDEIIDKQWVFESEQDIKKDLARMVKRAC